MKDLPISPSFCIFVREIEYENEENDSIHTHRHPYWERHEHTGTDKTLGRFPRDNYRPQGDEVLFYRFADFDTHVANAMAEYEAIEDEPTTVRSTSLSDSQPAAIYNLQGQRLDNPQRGVNIVGGNKKIADQ